MSSGLMGMKAIIASVGFTLASLAKKNNPTSYIRTKLRKRWQSIATSIHNCTTHGYKRNGLFIWHVSCSYGPRNNEEKINQNTQKVLAFLQLHTNSLPYDVGEDLTGPSCGGIFCGVFLCQEFAQK